MVTKHDNSLNILVVDDQSPVRQSLIMGLAALGYSHCSEANDVASARQILNTSLIDVIFCDINMPGEDGFDLLKHLAATSFQGDIILITGEEDEIAKSIHDIAKQYSLSLRGYITKPLLLIEVKALLLGCVKKMHIDSTAALELVTGGELDDLLENGSVVPHFQPKYSLENDKPVGVEVLARIRHQNNVLVYPDSFIPTAEKDPGKIMMLTKKVIERAFSQLCQCTITHHDFTVAVNISSVVLSDESFPNWLLNKTQKYGFTPENITCELTETALHGNKADIAIQMLRLRLLKFRLSIDDFGTGYSSIEQLHAIPFHELKLDKSFVMHCLDNRKSAAIVEQSINMAKALGIDIVAEGVETELVKVYLARLGCHFAQGYFFSKPVSISALEKLLNQPAPVAGGKAVK